MFKSYNKSGHLGNYGYGTGRWEGYCVRFGKETPFLFLLMVWEIGGYAVHLWKATENFNKNYCSDSVMR